MPQIVIDNPYASVVTILAILLLARSGFILEWARGKRQKRFDDVDLFERVRAVMNEQLSELRGEVTTLRNRIDQLEREANRRDALLRAAIGYVQTLLGYIAAHLPDRHDVPSVPPVLNEYMYDLIVPVAIPASETPTLVDRD